MAQNDSAAKPFTKFFPRTTYRPKKQESETKKEESYADHDEVIKFIATMKDRVQAFEASLEKQEKETAKIQGLVNDLLQWPWVCISRETCQHIRGRVYNDSSTEARNEFSITMKTLMDGMMERSGPENDVLVGWDYQSICFQE